VDIADQLFHSLVQRDIEVLQRESAAKLLKIKLEYESDHSFLSVFDEVKEELEIIKSYCVAILIMEMTRVLKN
jgi:hypothetical protein